MPHVTATATKMPSFGSNSQVYYDNLQNNLSPDFQIRALYFEEDLLWSLKKPQNITSVYLARLVIIISKQELQTSGVSAKAAIVWKPTQKPELNLRISLIPTSHIVLSLTNRNFIKPGVSDPRVRCGSP